MLIFGGFPIVDFNRLRRSNVASAVPIAAGILLDNFNVFLLLPRLFGAGRDWASPTVTSDRSVTTSARGRAVRRRAAPLALASALEDLGVALFTTAPSCTDRGRSNTRS